MRTLPIQTQMTMTDARQSIKVLAPTVRSKSIDSILHQVLYDVFITHYWVCPSETKAHEEKSNSWNGYLLFTDKLTRIRDPPKGCRLDDRTIAAIIGSRIDRKVLHLIWPTEFDMNGMIIFRRMSLGFAAKMWVNKRDTDRHDRGAIRAGRYYRWYRGVYLLCWPEAQNGCLFYPDPEVYERCFDMSSFGDHMRDWDFDKGACLKAEFDGRPSCIRRIRYHIICHKIPPSPRAPGKDEARFVVQILREWFAPVVSSSIPTELNFVLRNQSGSKG